MELDEVQTIYIRNLPDLSEMLVHAKVDENSLTEVSQALYYPSTNEDGLKLIELDEHLLAEIEAGHDLMFKGGLNEKAVLCSSSRTYDIKEAEISNSLLVIPDLKYAQETSTSPLKSPKNGLNRSADRSLEADDSMETERERTIAHMKVKKIFHEYFECREIKPRYKKISDLLKLTTYSGAENEFCVDESLLFTRQQLLATAQCSCEEFEAGLRRYRAFELNGYMRTLAYDYEYRILTAMLNLLSENSWELNAVDKAVTIELLEDIYPTEVLSGMFDLYTEVSAGGSSTATAEPKYTYREDMVCRLIAQNILQPGLKFRIDDFMETWQGALPEGMTINETYLNGIGIVDRESTSPSVQALYEENLSTNLADRLRFLFKIKEKWSAEQIQPYIEFFTSPQLGVTAILAKHARSLMLNGKRYYVSKH